MKVLSAETFTKAMELLKTKAIENYNDPKVTFGDIISTTSRDLFKDDTETFLEKLNEKEN